MRSDLTAAFQTQMSAQGRAPVQLGVFHFPVNGDVYVSDRDLGPYDGLTNTYSGIVEDWGVLEDLIGNSFETPTAPTRQMSLTLFNGGTRPFSDYFLSEDLESVFFELYQWFIGLSEADMALIDKFIVQDPIQFNERSGLIVLDLVSVSMRYDARIGRPLTRSEFPNAKIDDIGKPIDLIIGDAGQVNTICARTAPVASLNGSILSGTMTIATHEDLDDLNFSASGTIQIGEEKIRYSSRTASQFNVIQRGYLTEAAEHLDRDEICELVNDFTYLIGRGPVASIADVKIGGFVAPNGIYTVEPSLDPARIIFTEKPFAFRFAAGSTFLEMQFDAINSDNSARWPHRAYDAASDATAARIDSDYPRLSLKQVTVNQSRGEIVKAYLAVEHWEDKTFLNDFAQVEIAGVGVVGRLSRPNEQDTLNLDAEVDIDHGHSHGISGEHTHIFQDPGYVVDDESHTHASTLTSPPETKHPKLGSGLVVEIDPGQMFKVYYSGMPDKIEGGTLTFNAYISQCVLYCDGKLVSSEGHSKSFSISPKSHEYVTVFYCSRGNYSGSSIECRITNIKASVYESSAIAYENIDINMNMAYSGSNINASDKDPDDVDDLATDNRPIEITTSQTASRSHVNLFDITDQVNFNWSWFTNREVRVTYTGSDDDAKIYILHCFFDVEYRKKEVFFSDDVTATVQGLIDDSLGTVTGYQNYPIQRPDHVYKYLLTQIGGLDISDIDSSFDTAGARFAAIGYNLGGILSGDETVKDALKKIAFQTRSRYFYNAGKVKLSVLERLDDWPDGPELTASNVQLRSLTAQRQPVNDLVNAIDLFYRKDWTTSESSASGYSASVSQSDPVSIAQHGERKKPETFLFSLVRADAMAADLVDFYIDRLSVPSTYYQMVLYLENFDLERNDVFKLSYEVFHRLRKTKMMIASINRIFGSGKNNAINQIAVLTEVLRYFWHEETISNEIIALDALAVSLAFEADFDESVHALDALLSTHVCNYPLSVTMQDTLGVKAIYNPQHDETITPSEALTSHSDISLEDQVSILEDVDYYHHYGFGGGYFGLSGFGGYVIWTNRAPDEVQASESLTVDLDVSTFYETSTMADTLRLSNGFGTTLGSGFGSVPFGS
jgi:hypothetical protein